MDRLEFRIEGMSRRTVRRFQDHVRPRGGGSSSAFAGLTTKGLVLSSASLLVAYGLLSTPSVRVGGMRITATEAVVLVDTSGSMNSFVPAKNRALESLRSAGMLTGGQVDIGGSDSDLLGAITREIANRPRVDAVWVVSDFHDGTDLVNGSDRSRYNQLLALLRRRRVKLYMSTVDRSPPEDHIQAVEATGGDWASFSP